MKNFKLTIEYDGTDFCGWQIQKKGERTVQGELKRACDGIFKQEVTVIASGRTDSGVHALGQVVHFIAVTNMKPFEIQKALNSVLPKDIAVLKVSQVSLDFHAQYSVKEKTYRYTVLNAPHRRVMERHHTYFFPHPLNITAMRKAGKVLVGRHDFKAFQAHDPLRSERDTVRTIKRLTVNKVGDHVDIDVTANGFLYKMVRNIAGALLSVGSGQISVADITKILNAQDRGFAPATAPSCGLTLKKVIY